MKTQFKYSPLALMIASALSLSACGGDNVKQEAQTGVAGAEQASNVEASSSDLATVKLAVKFPEAEAAAAWIGDSALIEVSFFNTKDVGRIREAFDKLDEPACEGDYYYEYEFEDMVWDEETQQYVKCISDPDALKGQFATSVHMNTEAPSASVDLLPGKYRVEAKFFTAQGKHQETSVSYVTLSKGSHSLKLRGLEATWTATEELSLKLLNKTDGFDWDPATEGVQSAASVMGITGAIKGLHLPTVLTYPDGYLSNGGEHHQGRWDDILVNAGVMSDEALNRETQATAFQPVLRVSDGAGGEFNVLPRYLDTNEQELGEEGQYLGSHGSWNTSELATLKQEYTAEGEKALLDLGGYYMGYWSHSNETQESKHDKAELDFGLVWIDDDESKPYYIEHAYNADGEQLTIARVHHDARPDQRENWQQLFVDLQGQINKVVDGSTITGYLIETELHTTDVWGYEWSNTGADASPSFIEAAMLSLAEAEGLLATSAADEGCLTQELNGLAYSTEYLWDEAQQGWVPGTYNRFMEEGGLLDQLAVKITEVEGNVSGSQTSVIAAEESLATVQADIDAQVENYEGLIADQIASEQALYDADIAAIESSNTAIEASITDKQDAITAKEGEKVAKDGEILAKQVEIDAATDPLVLDALNAELATLESELDVIDSALLTLQSELTALEAELLAGQDEIATLTAARDAVPDTDPTVLEYEMSIVNLQNSWELANAQSNLDSANANQAAFEAELAQLQQLLLDTQATADLNGDGAADLFEAGKYVSSGSLGGYVSSSYDWGTDTYTHEVVFYDYTLADTVKASSHTGTQTICVQPFTLKASQLSMVFDTEADVIIE